MNNGLELVASNIADYVSNNLQNKYNTIRSHSEILCEPLENEDYGIQTTPFVSPPKWHLAHTAWFFETLLLKPYYPDYQEYHPLFAELFNSYYDTIGDYYARPERGLLSRPTVKEVYAYRAYIDEHMNKLMRLLEDHPNKAEIEHRIILGLNHEQQHQELLLTDIKHIFAYNPLKPVYRKTPQSEKSHPTTLQYLQFSGGLKDVGHVGSDFCYDNELPRHKVYIPNFRLASRLITNAEYLEFMNSGAYQESDYWLSDAWKAIKQQNWNAPLYWQKQQNQWHTMTLNGLQPIDENQPVCHVSYYEAAAYARWAGKRLPTEQEWEVVAENVEIKGNFRESGLLNPKPASNSTDIQQMFGDVWEWTQSPYSPYPGYKQLRGPLGEYNGKFMSSQMVLRGGSCVTPSDHLRSSYRNFFYPEERWQFSGIRLAEDS